jgi:hypothetical protein
MIESVTRHARPFLIAWSRRAGRNKLVKIHGVGPLNTIITHVALLVRDVVQDERSHGSWEWMEAVHL